MSTACSVVDGASASSSTYAQALALIDGFIEREGTASVIAIVGATGTGKSDLAERIAENLHLSVISADSMQVYRRMDIGTAKVAPDERRVSYHGIDLIDPGEAYSAACYQSYARDVIEAEHRAGRPALLCGGSGLYIRAACDDFDFAEGTLADNPSRRRYELLADEEGGEALHRLLEERDPESAALIHPHNVRRMVRALELNEAGRSYARSTEGMSTYHAIYPALFIGIRYDRPQLYRRIDARVDDMMSQGLLDEVKGLVDDGYRDALTAMQAIGYKEFFPVLDGKVGLPEAVEDVKRATRRFAKRQGTWFGRDARIVWLDGSKTGERS